MVKQNLSTKGHKGKRSRMSAEARAWLPRPDFPLSPHLPTRRWYRRIRGTRYYFGSLDDSRAAEDRYNRVKDDLYAGRTPRDPGDSYTVAQMCNEYLTAQHDKVLAGDLQHRTATASAGAPQRWTNRMGFSGATNSGYINGDELVCLTRIAADNLTPAGCRMLLGPVEKAEASA